MRKRWQRLARVALPVTALLFACCGLPLYFVNHLRMEDRPELLYPYYESRLHDYGRRLSAGEVNCEETRKYGIPQYLIDHGARYCTKQGECFRVAFGFIADSAVPELWYSSISRPAPPYIRYDIGDPATRDQILNHIEAVLQSEVIRFYELVEDPNAFRDTASTQLFPCLTEGDIRDYRAWMPGS